MGVQSVHPLPHGGILPNGPVPPVPPVTASQRVTGQVVVQHDERQTAGTSFSKQDVFMHWADPLGRGRARTVTQKTSLAQRRSRSAEKRAALQARGAEIAQDDDAYAISGKALTAVGSLAMDLAQQDGGSGGRGLDEKLRARGYDIEERLKAVRGKLEQAVAEQWPQEKIGRLRRTLDKLERQLAKHELHALRRAMQDPFDFDARIEQVRGSSGKKAEPTRRDLRVLGPRPNVEKDRVDLLLKAQSVHKFVARTAEPGKYRLALAVYRKRCLDSSLRKRASDVNQPEIWRAWQDSRIFTLVETAHALAEELRERYAAETKRAPAISVVDGTELLLLAAEQGWSKGRADGMVKSIAGDTDLDDLGKARVYLLMCDIMARLYIPAAVNPDTRYGLLREMREKGYELGTSLPVKGATSEEKLEARLLGGMPATQERK